MSDGDRLDTGRRGASQVLEVRQDRIVYIEEPLALSDCDGDRGKGLRGREDVAAYVGYPAVLDARPVAHAYVDAFKRQALVTEGSNRCFQFAARPGF
jgi:hypothetical protein